MEKLQDVQLGPCPDSRFLRPQRVHFTQVCVCGPGLGRQERPGIRLGLGRDREEGPGHSPGETGIGIRTVGVIGIRTVGVIGIRTVGEIGDRDMDCGSYRDTD
ncbi:hypothetical protein chiPu_0021836, partial [Chiloscyllium punctatum]|nr:hypothetical protein [Chiloscyllium punctatum]